MAKNSRHSLNRKTQLNLDSPRSFVGIIWFVIINKYKKKSETKETSDSDLYNKFNDIKKINFNFQFKYNCERLLTP